MSSDSEDDDVEVAVASTSHESRTLRDRCPSVDDVLIEVKAMQTIQGFFNNSRHFSKKSEQEIFFNAHDLWHQVSEKLMSAITKHTPTREKDAEKKTKLYNVEKDKIIDLFIGKHELFTLAEDGSSADNARYWEMKSILIMIGIKYVLWFQKLITPPGGEDRVPIIEQIETIVRESINVSVQDLFPDMGIGERVYYVIGFLCSAGAKEAG